MDNTKLIEFLNSLENHNIPGCDCIIYKDHKQIFRHMAGFADDKRSKPITGDTTYWLYSASKLFTCTALMQLVDKGEIRLDDPVYTYLPEYKDLKVQDDDHVFQAKNTMTIRHLLTMQSGLNYILMTPSIKEVLKNTNNQASTRQVIKALANEPLDFEPGTRYQYSLSHDVLGAIIEVVSGLSFGQYLEEHIFKPLHMKNTGFILTPERKANMSEQFQYEEDIHKSISIGLKNAFVSSYSFESGGGGLISTTDDYILFLDAMAGGGVSQDGHKLLSMESIDEMRRDQLEGPSRKDFDLLGKLGYSYGLGVRTLVDKEISGAKSPLGEFGWDGAAAFALIDVENHISIFYIQHVLNCGFAFDVVHPKVRDLAYEMLGLK